MIELNNVLKKSFLYIFEPKPIKIEQKLDEMPGAVLQKRKN